MQALNITILSKDELLKKQHLEEEVAKGIEVGKRGFQQAVKALVEIDQLVLWRDEAGNFDTYRKKFNDTLNELDITGRHLNRLIAAEKCVQMLRPMGLNISQHKERQIRPLTRFKDPSLAARAYERALNIAENEGQELKADHMKRAADEIKPSKKKPPRPQIGQNVKIAPHHPDEELAGQLGIIIQHPAIDRCIVRLENATSKLVPDNLLEVISEKIEIRSVKQEQKEKARELGLRTGLQALPDIKNEELTVQNTDEEFAISMFLKSLPNFSHQQKLLIYEQLLKSGFNPEIKLVS